MSILHIHLIVDKGVCLTSCILSKSTHSKIDQTQHLYLFLSLKKCNIYVSNSMIFITSKINEKNLGS